MRKLKPAFAPDGCPDRWSRIQLSDGASALVVASEEAARAMKVEPMARIVGYGTGR